MMAKTKYNQAAMKYVMDYLDQLLEVEDLVNEKVEKRIDMMLERKLAEQQRKTIQTDEHATATHASARATATDSSKANID